MSITTQTIEILSISTSLIASGGIAAFSAFCIPLLTSQPASRSLPGIRWLFSRGSHVFPTASIISCSGFTYLAYTSLPPQSTASLATLLKYAVQGKPGLYLAAAALSISIAPFTAFAMIPTNFALIEKNEDLGGAKGQKSAEYRDKIGAQKRSAEKSVDNVDDISQVTDLSGPQGKTREESSEAQDREARELLEKFGRLNWVRAVLIGVGGVVGLMGAMV